MKRIETMVGLFAHLISRPINPDSKFDDVWNEYFSSPTDGGISLGEMSYEEIVDWLNEEV